MNKDADEALRRADAKFRDTPPCSTCGHPAGYHDGDWDCAGCLADWFGSKPCDPHCKKSFSQVLKEAGP